MSFCPHARSRSLESEMADLEIKNEVAEEKSKNAEELKPLVKLRVVRKHKLRT